MTEPHLSAGTALALAAAGAGFTAAADQAALAFFGLPAAAITSAASGALVPALFQDPQPLLRALRHWLGSVLLSLSITAVVVLWAGLPDRGWAIGVAGVAAAFARDLYAALRGELPPIITALRTRVFGRGAAPREGP